MYLLGYDIGSSSIKACLLDAQSGAAVATATSPKQELPMAAPQPGWAEQDPETWWRHVKQATAELGATPGVDLHDVGAIGISYQMHGLVLVDAQGQVLRPAIIWCDSRAVEAGRQAAEALGARQCLERLLNLPGNFTASKLKWVKDHEPDIYARAAKFMLPGDYIALKLSGAATTTVSGLSEGILWDFQAERPAEMLLDYYGIDPSLLCDRVPTFEVQGELTAAAASELGLKPGVKLAYRGGDQPNNALSLNVLNPGEVAATAGTSGVVYGISDQANYDTQSRVNTFVHVNHLPGKPRYGVLLCVNGTGILNSWLRAQVGAAALDYGQMNELAAKVPVGADGLVVLPFGNGAERTLNNRDVGASIVGLHFNRHHRGHLFRAAQEGIVFALNYGLEIMRAMGAPVDKVRAGHANMFLSPLFAEAFACVTGAPVEMYRTDGAQGAARGAGMGAGVYPDAAAAFVGLDAVGVVEPDADLVEPYQQAYQRWRAVLEPQLDLA